MNLNKESLLKTIYPSDITEFGFFFAMMLSPFGPLFRYLGWTIILFGLFRQKNESLSFLKALPRFVKISFLTILIYGAFVTLINQFNPTLWVKGYSLVVEFAFGVVASAFILRTQKAFDKWQLYIKIFAVIYGILSIIGYLRSGTNTAIFSLYTFTATISIPLFASVFSVFFFPPVEKIRKFLGYSSAALLVIMVILGLSSGALISNLFCLAIMILAFRPKFKTVAICSLLAACIIGCSGFYIYSQPGESPVKQQLIRETSQLTDFKDLSHFTSDRNKIWESALLMVKKKPLGIGWGQFEYSFEELIKNGALPSDTTIACSTHNEFVSALTEGGYPSLFAFILLWIGCFYFIVKNRKRLNKKDFVILLGSLAGMFVFSMVGSILDERKILAFYFWINFGAIIGQSYALKESAGAES